MVVGIYSNLVIAAAAAPSPLAGNTSVFRSICYDSRFATSRVIAWFGLLASAQVRRIGTGAGLVSLVAHFQDRPAAGPRFRTVNATCQRNPSAVGSSTANASMLVCGTCQLNLADRV